MGNIPDCNCCDERENDKDKKSLFEKPVPFNLEIHNHNYSVSR